MTAADRLEDLKRQEAEWEKRKVAARGKGSESLERLMRLAETIYSGQPRRIALFLGAVWNDRRHFDLRDLRMVDVEIGDDMLATLDALRWGAGLDELVPSAEARIEEILKSWDMYGPGQTGQAIV